MYELSKRSLEKLEGVDIDLVTVVCDAIKLTTIDFGVVQGLRTIEEQKELVAKGASQTMKSKHLDGKAVDLMAYVNGKGCWELNVYDELAEAMAEAAVENNVGIRWGGAWSVPDIREWNGTMEDAMQSYIDLRRSQGKRPFIDAPHFELIK
jgi:peptidoglycan L-alanyl-D-glutamate endopeptidase CwlK